jgi:hypothetical protein
LQSTAVKPPVLNGKRRSKGGGADELTSSIEQFSSPEKRATTSRPNGVSTTTAEGKGKALLGDDADTIESDSFRRRGQELAENAFREKVRQKRLLAPKKPLAAVVTRKVQVPRHNASPKNGGLKRSVVPAMPPVLTPSENCISADVMDSYYINLNIR